MPINIDGKKIWLNGEQKTQTETPAPVAKPETPAPDSQKKGKA